MTNNEHPIFQLLERDDDHNLAIRQMMIDLPLQSISDDDLERFIDADDDTIEITIDDLRHILNTLTPIMIDPYQRELRTALALRLTLCPLHFIDYAICFDDDDDECAAIRLIHPEHDS